MKTSVLLLSMGLAIGALDCAAEDTPAPAGSSQQALSEVRSACAADVQKLCSGVQPGGGRILQCLKEHKEQVSQTCKQAVLKAKQNPAT